MLSHSGFVRNVQPYRNRGSLDQRILYALTEPRVAQFFIAAHSPMLLTFPGAQILSLDGGYIHPVKYDETDHYCIMRDFLNAPDRFYRYLFEEDEEES